MCSGCSGDYCSDFTDVDEFSKESGDGAETSANGTAAFLVHFGNVGWREQGTGDLETLLEFLSSSKALEISEDYEILVSAEYIKERRIVRAIRSTGWVPKDTNTRGVWEKVHPYSSSHQS